MRIEPLLMEVLQGHIVDLLPLKRRCILLLALLVSLVGLLLHAIRRGELLGSLLSTAVTWLRLTIGPWHRLEGTFRGWYRDKATLAFGLHQEVTLIQLHFED